MDTTYTSTAATRTIPLDELSLFAVLSQLRTPVQWHERFLDGLPLPPKYNSDTLSTDTGITMEY